MSSTLTKRNQSSSITQDLIEEAISRLDDKNSVCGKLNSDTSGTDPTGSGEYKEEVQFYTDYRNIRTKGKINNESLNTQQNSQTMSERNLRSKRQNVCYGLEQARKPGRGRGRGRGRKSNVMALSTSIITAEESDFSSFQPPHYQKKYTDPNEVADDQSKSSEPETYVIDVELDPSMNVPIKTPSVQESTANVLPNTSKARNNLASKDKEPLTEKKTDRNGTKIFAPNFSPTDFDYNLNQISNTMAMNSKEPKPDEQVSDRFLSTNNDSLILMNYSTEKAVTKTEKPLVCPLKEQNSHRDKVDNSTATQFSTDTNVNNDNISLVSNSKVATEIEVKSDGTTIEQSLKDIKDTNDQVCNESLITSNADRKISPKSDYDITEINSAPNLALAEPMPTRNEADCLISDISKSIDTNNDETNSEAIMLPHIERNDEKNAPDNPTNPPIIDLNINNVISKPLNSNELNSDDFLIEARSTNVQVLNENSLVATNNSQVLLQKYLSETSHANITNVTKCSPLPKNSTPDNSTPAAPPFESNDDASETSKIAAFDHNAITPGNRIADSCANDINAVNTQTSKENSFMAGKDGQVSPTFEVTKNRYTNSSPLAKQSSSGLELDHSIPVTGLGNVALETPRLMVMGNSESTPGNLMTNQCSTDSKNIDSQVIKDTSLTSSNAIQILPASFSQTSYGIENKTSNNSSLNTENKDTKFDKVPSISTLTHNKSPTHNVTAKDTEKSIIQASEENSMTLASATQTAPDPLSEISNASGNNMTNFSHSKQKIAPSDLDASKPPSSREVNDVCEASKYMILNRSGLKSDLDTTNVSQKQPNDNETQLPKVNTVSLRQIQRTPINKSVFKAKRPKKQKSLGTPISIPTSVDNYFLNPLINIEGNTKSACNGQETLINSSEASINGFEHELTAWTEPENHTPYFPPQPVPPILCQAVRNSENILNQKLIPTVTDKGSEKNSSPKIDNNNSIKVFNDNILDVNHQYLHQAKRSPPSIANNIVLDINGINKSLNQNFIRLSENEKKSIDQSLVIVEPPLNPIRVNPSEFITTNENLNERQCQAVLSPFPVPPITAKESFSEDESQDFLPLFPALSLPPFPSTQHCSWSFDESSRVLLADFKGDNVLIDPVDYSFLLQMMERDDISLIIDGLAHYLDTDLWSKEYIDDCVGQDFFHRVRSFKRIEVDKNGKELKASCRNSSQETPYKMYKEKKGMLSMKISDYIRYLNQRSTCFDNASEPDPNTNLSSSSSDLGSLESLPEDDDDKFTYHDENNKKKSLNYVDTVLYMIDYDITKVLPSLYADLLENFKLPDLLPGGTHCMMHSVNPGGRPFMGPNLYLTPSGSFTHLHQDGHGTVDSGHLCLSGYNEVVILRRMTEERKKHALNLLNDTNSDYDALYGWPSEKAIVQCKEMNYHPSVFILKPGQFLHINKGRLHAFRKLSTDLLPPTDCHSKRRARMIVQENIDYSKTLCLSVAWDWMFKGVSAEGINSEVSSILECAKLNRENESVTLAIPETCLLHMARIFPAEYRKQCTSSKSFKLKRRETCAPKTIEVLKGILPSLQYLVFRHVDATIQAYQEKERLSDSKVQRVSIGSKPNSWENPQFFALDPYGNSDFFCKLCGQELSNLYMHCDGCELILNKDFNICVSCHAEDRYKIKYQMHPLNPAKHSTINHTGAFVRMNQGRCPCKKGPVCKNCTYCAGCSCKCHRWFTLHHRFMNVEDEIKLLRRVESIVGNNIIQSSKETLARLSSGLIFDPGKLENMLEQVKNGNFDKDKSNSNVMQRVSTDQSHSHLKVSKPLSQKEASKLPENKIVSPSLNRQLSSFQTSKSFMDAQLNLVPGQNITFLSNKDEIMRNACSVVESQKAIDIHNELHSNSIQTLSIEVDFKVKDLDCIPSVKDDNIFDEKSKITEVSNLPPTVLEVGASTNAHIFDENKEKGSVHTSATKSACNADETAQDKYSRKNLKRAAHGKCRKDFAIAPEMNEPKRRKRLNSEGYLSDVNREQKARDKHKRQHIKAANHSLGVFKNEYTTSPGNLGETEAEFQTPNENTNFLYNQEFKTIDRDDSGNQPSPSATTTSCTTHIKPAVKKKRKKRDKNAPKKNKSPFHHYSLVVYKVLKQKYPEATRTQLGKCTKIDFDNLPKDQLDIYKALAVKDKERYNDDMAEYEAKIKSVMCTEAVFLKDETSCPAEVVASQNEDECDISLSTRKNQEILAAKDKKSYNDDLVEYEAKRKRMMTAEAISLKADTIYHSEVVASQNLDECGISLSTIKNKEVLLAKDEKSYNDDMLEYEMKRKKVTSTEVVYLEDETNCPVEVIGSQIEDDCDIALTTTRTQEAFLAKERKRHNDDIVEYEAKEKRVICNEAMSWKDKIIYHSGMIVSQNEDECDIFPLSEKTHKNLMVKNKDRKNDNMVENVLKKTRIMTAEVVSLKDETNCHTEAVANQNEDECDISLSTKKTHYFPELPTNGVSLNVNQADNKDIYLPFEGSESNKALIKNAKENAFDSSKYEEVLNNELLCKYPPDSYACKVINKVSLNVGDIEGTFDVPSPESIQPNKESNVKVENTIDKCIAKCVDTTNKDDRLIGCDHTGPLLEYSRTIANNINYEVEDEEDSVSKLSNILIAKMDTKQVRVTINITSVQNIQAKQAITIADDDFLFTTKESCDKHPGNYRLKKLINEYRKEISKVESYQHVARNMLLQFQVLYPYSRCLSHINKSSNVTWELMTREKVIEVIENRLRYGFRGSEEENSSSNEIKIEKLNIQPTQNDVFIYRESSRDSFIIGSQHYRNSVNANSRKDIVVTQAVINETAEEIVRKVSSLFPPGRFLERKPGLGTAWEEMSKETSLEITSLFLSDGFIKDLGSTFIDKVANISNAKDHKIILNDNDVVKQEHGHPGTVKYHELIDLYVLDAVSNTYVSVAESIHSVLRSMNPPGRFLKKVGEGKLYEEATDAQFKNAIIRDLATQFKKSKKNKKKF